MENDTFCGGLETESTEGDFDVDPFSPSSSALTDHWTVGMVAMVMRLESTPSSTAETEGDVVFQESWLYMLADDVAVDITTETAVKAAVPGKEYSAEDSFVGVHLQKE